MAENSRGIQLIPGKMLCRNCKVKWETEEEALLKTDQEGTGSQNNICTPSQSCVSVAASDYEIDLAIEHLNKCFPSIGQSPLNRKKLSKKRYAEDKITNLSAVIKKKIRLISPKNKLK